MKPARYREQWRALAAEPSAEALEGLSARVAGAFMDRHFYSAEYNAEYIDLLCEMATACQEAALNEIAARALFGIVVERLCDDFEELQTGAYNRLLSQVAAYLCRLPAGAELAARLKGFGMDSQAALFQRIESMRLAPDKPVPPDLRPQKLLVLSRVTIGADVAITSVVCQRLLSRFPEAELLVIGSPKLRQLFSAESGIRIRELGYTRRGGLLARFEAWLHLLAIVQEETAGLPEGGFLVLDPDSRLTQLGLLPLVDDSSYRFFNSRGKPASPPTATVSQLANLWLDTILQTSDYCHPKVWLPAGALAQAERLLQGARAKGRRLIALNLGVGGNERKRVGEAFERALLLHLLEDPANLLLLDLGFGEAELARSRALLAAASQAGYATEERDFSAGKPPPPQLRLLGIQSSVAEVGALIACSQEFIGYDSACQHLAAALGVPTFTLFAGTTSPRFVRRWHASGPAESEILFVDTISRMSPPDPQDIIARLQDLRTLDGD